VSARSAVFVAVTALALVHALGCGAGLAPAFDPSFPDDDARRTQLVQERLARAASEGATAQSDGLLVAASHGPAPELIAYDVAARRVRWRQTFRADSRPELLGDAVCSASGERLFAFAADSGRARFSARLAGCSYLGAARDGERIFAACQRVGGAALDARARLTALDARSGRVLWEREAAGTLGRPAATAGLVFVPWQRQNLVVLDARDGRELARVRARDDVIEWVSAAPGGVFFGQRTVHRLGASGTVQAALGHALIDTQALPGRPPLVASAFESQPGTRSARGRVALYFEPAADGGGVRIAHGRFYAVFYRYVFAYDAGGTLRWARMLAHDAIAGRALPEGLAVVTERGQLLLLSSEHGQAVLAGDLAEQLASARLSVAAIGGLPAASHTVPLALRRSLTEMALDRDNRLVPARAYAIAQLAAMPEPEVTRDLLDIYAQAETAPELRRVVADALRARRAGLEHLVDALLARFDFLEQTRPAPLAVIVPALVEARETRALPNLVQRMFDHETPLAVLPTVVSAVAQLGGQSAVEPLLSLLRLYRADSTFAAQPEALIAAARGVLAHGGEQGAAALAAIAADGRMSPVLAAAVAALRAPSAATDTPEAAVAAAPQQPPLPETLDQAAVNAVFAEHTDDLRACIIDEIGRNPNLAQVRIALIAESDGSAHAFSFVPNTPAFVDCLYAKVAGYRFPRFRAGREVVKYVVAVRAREPAAAPAGSSPDGEPWWAWYASRPRASVEPRPADPWWRSRQPLAPLAITAKAAAAQPAPAQAAPANALQPSPSPSAPVLDPTREAKPPSTPKAADAPPTQPTATQPPAAEDAWWLPTPAQSKQPGD
jgi:outer membrane protein assembly factor BamB